ncbi:MAG: DUF3810 domain-containing protein [Lachnospiraceae bacterium]|nr:DUF3810 domain-containing protein [Lachnospiraceae bacterium]
MKKANRRRILLLIFCVLFNAAAWMSRGFSDWYTNCIFPLWGRTYGRLTSLFPFSVGEWAILFGLLWLFVLFLRTVLALPARMAKKEKRFRKSLGRMPALTADLLTGIALIMSLNCFVLYHCTPLDRRADEHAFSQTELAALRDLIVEECNERAATIARDPDGQAVFSDEPEELARTAVRTLGTRLFPRLGGYSVRPKTFFFSDFVSQQYMMGYYFPFTMEANINGRMETLNRPFTMCHELAHTHGYIYEDEANLIGFLACLSSDDPAFVYSGYLGVLPYVNRDFHDNVGDEIYAAHPAISDQVRVDVQFLSKESWAAVEKNAVLDTEMVRRAADTFIDQNQKLNGVRAGKASYSHVVALLLSYYAGEASYLQP